MDLEWDGGLKRSSPKPTKKHQEQKVYSKKIQSEIEKQDDDESALESKKES